MVRSVSYTHLVVEGEAAALTVPLDHLLGQDLILLLQDGQIRLGQGAGIAGVDVYKRQAWVSLVLPVDCVERCLAPQ